MVIKRYDVVALAKATWGGIDRNQIGVYATAMAYNFLFSLFPLLIFLGAITSVVVDKQQIETWLMARIAATVPPAAVDIVQATTRELVFTSAAPGLLSIGLLLTVWSGSGVFGSLITALNDAYEVRETRPWWRQQVLRLASFAASGVVFLVATVILLNGEGIVQWIGGILHLQRAARLVWIVAQFPLAIAFQVGLLWLLYCYLPNVRHQARAHVLFGAVLTTVLWLLATLIFRVYVQHFGGYNKAYGAIGAVMLLLTWMYYSMFVLLAGGVLISELTRGAGRIADRHTALVPVPAPPSDHAAPKPAAAAAGAPRTSRPRGASTRARPRTADVISPWQPRRGLGALLYWVGALAITVAGGRVARATERRHG